MLIIPAVDIKDGKVVRLVQGRADRETVYGDDPVSAAKAWADQGAKRIHLVDLDGALEGRPLNMKWTLRIVREVSVEVEVGGGLRSSAAVDDLLEAGATRCIIGTKAVEDRDFLADLAERWAGRISVGMDAVAGRIATRGWVSASELTATDLLGKLYDLSLGEVIYTDIARDGMLGGPNLAEVENMLRACPFPLISSGGVTTPEHVRRLRELGCFGCIIGKAFYDGKMSFAEAQAAAEETRKNGG